MAMARSNAPDDMSSSGTTLLAILRKAAARRLQWGSEVVVATTLADSLIELANAWAMNGT